jgi:hypothetical protein
MERISSVQLNQLIHAVEERSMVLLPQPEGPMMAVIFCRWIARLISLTA